MKKTLLFAFASALSIFSANAQTTTWDFSNDATTWPLNASGIGTTPIVKAGLGLNPIPTNGNFGVVTNSSQVTFSDGYVGTGNRFQTNGGAAITPGTNRPTQRYFFIETNGPATVKAWYKSGSGGSVRTAYVSNGASTLYASAATSPTATPADTAILSANIPTAGTFYLYTDAAMNFYKIEVTGAAVVTTIESNTLATSEAANKNKTVVFAQGNTVHINKVKENAQVEVYNMNGALVKTLNTKADTSFELQNKGVYIVNVKSNNGSVSQKVLIK